MTSAIVDGRAKLKDLISEQFNCESQGIKLHQFRNIAATALYSHPVYASRVVDFLANAPKRIEEVHYAAPSEKMLAEAVTWLRSQFL